MLKQGCTPPNLANICLHKSSSAKFYPFTETDKDLLQKFRENMVGGPSIVFTRNALVDDTFIRNSGKICKSFVGIDASQLYPYSMCQPMPTGLYTLYTGTQKKIDCFKVEGFCAHCNTVFEAMGCIYHYCSCQEARLALIEEDIERGNKKR